VPLWSVHADGRSHSAETCTSDPFLTYCVAMSASLFQQLTLTHSVSLSPARFLRLTATENDATRCSPTSRTCGSLPTKPVTCVLMLVPMMFSPLRVCAVLSIGPVPISDQENSRRD